MAGFLRAHLLEDSGGTRKALPQAMREIGKDTLVFFFQRYRQGQDLGFG